MLIPLFQSKIKCMEISFTRLACLSENKIFVLTHKFKQFSVRKMVNLRVFIVDTISRCCSQMLGKNKEKYLNLNMFCPHFLPHEKYWPSLLACIDWSFCLFVPLKFQWRIHLKLTSLCKLRGTTNVNHQICNQQISLSSLDTARSPVLDEKCVREQPPIL